MIFFFLFFFFVNWFCFWKKQKKNTRQCETCKTGERVRVGECLCDPVLTQRWHRDHKLCLVCFPQLCVVFLIFLFFFLTKKNTNTKNTEFCLYFTIYYWKNVLLVTKNPHLPFSEGFANCMRDQFLNTWKMWQQFCLFVFFFSIVLYECFFLRINFAI